MNLVKKLKVFHLLCLLKIDREIMFADVLNTQGSKHIIKIIIKKGKIRIFPTGLVHGFRQKFEIS